MTGVRLASRKRDRLQGACNLNKTRTKPRAYDGRGIDCFDKVIDIIEVDQPHASVEPGDVVPTFFTHVRELVLADAGGQGAATWPVSFNRPRGCCETCKGDGQIKIEMPPSPRRLGLRHASRQPETPECASGKSISPTCSRKVEEAPVLAKIPKIRRVDNAHDGYGLYPRRPAGNDAVERRSVCFQPSSSRRSHPDALYILDEPMMAPTSTTSRSPRGAAVAGRLGNTVLVSSTTST